MPRPRLLFALLALSLALAACTDTAETPPPTARPAPAEAASAADDSWLVMLYQDADDEVLEQDIFTDLNEAELVGSSDNVRLWPRSTATRARFAATATGPARAACISPRTTT